MGLMGRLRRRDGGCFRCVACMLEDVVRAMYEAVE
jgi:hypothetical protein